MPIVALRRRQRVSGEPYLHGLLAEDVTIPAGAEITLRRLRPDGPGESPTHALVIVPPRRPLTDKARAQAKADRLDGSAVRVDPRDG